MTSVPTPGPGRRADSRLPVGLLLAGVAIIALVVIAPRLAGGGAAGADPSPSGSVAAVAATPSPSASVAASGTPATPATPAPSDSAAPAPSSTVVQQGIAECVRTSAAACTKAIGLARKGHETDVALATRIVVDDTCPPTTMCDRKYPFDAIVVFVTAGADTTGWYSYHVYGLDYDKPTNAEPWLPDVPDHVVARLREPQPTT